MYTLMNEDNRKRVYDVLKEQTGYLDSYEDFNKAFDASEDNRKRVYDVLKNQTGYLDSYEDFTKGMSAPVTSVAQQVIDEYDQANQSSMNTGAVINDNSASPQLQQNQSPEEDKRTLFSNYVQEQLGNINKELNKPREALPMPAGSAFIPSTAVAAAQRYGNTQTREQQDRYTSLVAARNFLDDANKIVTEAGKKGNTNFMAGALRGARDKGFDPDTWMMGISEASYYDLLRRAAEKEERGEQLSPEETQLLDAAAVNMAANAYYAQDLGRGYKAGAVTAESIPFMLQFALNPVSGAGKGIAKTILQHGIKRFGLNTAKRTAAGRALRGAARVAGDAMAAAGLTATTSLGNVAEDAERRMTGDVKFAEDDKGNIQYAGRENNVGTGEAIARAFTSTFFENQSEMVGNYFAPIMRGVSGLLKRLPGVKQLSASKVGEIYRGIKSNPTYKEFTDRTQWHGAIGEYAEEVCNNLASVAMGDMTPEELVDLNNNIDTFLGVGLMSAVFDGIGAAGFARDRYMLNRDVKRFEATLSPDEIERWNEVKRVAQSGDVEGVREFVKYTMRDSSLTPQEKKDEIKYIYDVMRQSAMENVAAEQTEETVQAETEDIVANSDPQTNTYTECNRLVMNDVGETVEVPGHIVGYMGGQPLWKPDGAGPEVEAVVLKEGEYNSESIQSMPTQEVIDETAAAIREDAAAQAQRESTYSPDIVPPQVGVTFTDSTGQYQIAQQNPDGGWIATKTTMDDKGNPKQEVVSVTDEQYYNAMQAQIDVQEAQSQQQHNNLSTDEANNTINPTETESNVPEQSPQSAPSEGTEETSGIPTDEKGNLLYHRAPVETTVASINGEGLEPEEVDAFIQANRDASAKLLKNVEGKSPKMGTNIAQFKKAKQEWQQRVADAQSQVDYWNQVEDAIRQQRMQVGDTTAEDILAMGEPMDGRELAAQMLATGKLPLLQSDFKRETGYKGDESRSLFGLFASEANGGMTIERAGEQLMLADQEAGTHFFDQSDPNAGRNAILDVLSEVRTRGDLTNYIRRNREAMAERERQAEYDAYSDWCEREMHMTPEEYESYQGYVATNNPYEGVAVEELDRIFAEDEEEIQTYSNQQDNGQGTSENGSIPDSGSSERDEPAGETENGQGGLSVLPEAQPVLSGQIQGRAGGTETEPGTADDGVRVEEGTVSEGASGGERITGEQTEGGASGVEARPAVSQETDENGYPFVLASDGTSTFGNITEETGLPIAPIKLSSGFHSEDGKGYGLAHIEYRHGEQIRNAGFPSIEAFVEDVAKNFTVIKRGNARGENKTYLLEVQDAHNNTLFIELSKDGSYWNVNSAGIFKKGYSKKKDIVWTLPALGSSTNADATEVNHGQTEGETVTSGDSSQTISSENKGSESTQNDQTNNEFIAPERQEDESLLDYAERVVKVKEIDDARKEVSANPTDAQKEAGNYKKGHITLDGYDITIENPKGSTRSGVDVNGQPWSVTMNNDYGYIRGTEGVDGDHIDVFLSDDPTTGDVFVIDQVNDDGTFDEHKVMYGFSTADEARDAYLANYSPGWKGLGTISEVSKEEFKKWIGSSHRKTKPFAEYKSVKVEGAQSEAIKTHQPHALPGRLMKAYESGNASLITSMEQEMREFVNGATDMRSVYATYLRSKDLERAVEKGSPSNKTQHFIAGTCKDALKKAGLPAKAMQSERARTEVAGSTTDPHMLDVMSADTSFNVLRAIVHNPNISEATLKYFTEAFSNNGLDYEAQQELEKRQSANGDELRFREDAEDKKELVAVHNLSADKLKQAFDLGGFPMPSIAITKADVGHTEFGEISLVFDKESINPTDGRNKVYGEDAWTPTFPTVGYKLNDNKTSDIYRRANKAGSLPLFNPVIFHPDNYESYISSVGSESLVNHFKNDYGAKQLYLSENGNAVEKYEQHEVDKYLPDQIALYEKMLKEIGIERLKNERSDALENDVKRLIEEHYDIDLDTMKPFRAKVRINNTIHHAVDYAEQGNRKIETDIEVTKKKIDERIDPEKFEAWLENLFSGVVEKNGIRNDKDMFTPSGSSRKWEQLYDDITLDSVVKAMQRQAARGGQGLFNGSIFGAAQKEYKSIDEIRKEARERIRTMDDSEYKAQRDAITDRLSNIKISGVGNGFSDTMDMAGNIQDAVARSHTAKGIHKYLKGFYPKVTMETASEIADIVKDIQRMSARYFEAKPYRAVGFDEVRLAVVPSDMDKKLVRELEQRGIPVRIYEKGNESQRRQIVEEATEDMNLRFRKTQEENESFNGNYSDDALSSANDPVAKMMGKSTRTARQRQVFAERERRNMAARVQELAEKLHLDNVEIVNEPMTITDRKGKTHHPKGFYNPRTGKIVIVVPNNMNTFDIEQTLLHEAVAHYGLRKLFGEHFDTFLDNVFNNADLEVRRKIVELAKKNGWDTRLATEEYLASLAENTNFEDLNASWWQKIKELFLQMLHKIGFNDFNGVTLSDNELRYILWRSYENLAEPGRYRSILGEAADVVKQNELKVGNYASVNGNVNQVADARESVKAERIRKLRDSKPVEITGEEYQGKYELNRDSAQKYLLDHLRGEYTIKDTGEKVELSKVGAKKVTSHSMGNEAHLKSIAAIPQIIHNAIFIEERPPYKEDAKYDTYRYYVTGLKIGGKDYTVRMMIGVKNGEYYYDHYLTDIEKGNLIEIAKGFTPTEDAPNPSYAEDKDSVSSSNTQKNKKEIEKGKLLDLINGQASYDNGFGTTPGTKPTTEIFSNYKDKILLSILQTNDEENLLFRETPDGETTDDGSRDAYNRSVTGNRFKAQEAYQDSMLALKRLQEVVEKFSGQKLKSYENAYMAENQMSSKSTRETEVYGERFFKPMLQEVANIIKKGASYQKIIDYMIAKHGLERNEVFAERDASQEADRRFEKLYKELEQLYKLGGITQVEYDHRKDKIDSEKEEYYQKRLAQHLEEDYSGLTALAEKYDEADKGFKANAEDLVNNFEARFDTRSLWEKVNAATKETLRKSYESGMMSRDTYENVSKMFNNYIPLRGWDVETAEDVFEYLNSETSPVNSVLKSAKGRRSMSDDPLATIGNMAESTILQGNRNLMKQNFLNMAINHPTDVLTVREAWYVKDPSTGEWVLSFPNIEENDDAYTITRKMEEHEERMNMLKEKGEATQVKEGLNIDYRISARQAKEHIVNVKRNGKDYLIFVNGNPRAAQAVNGQTNPNVENGWMAGVSRFNRWMAANFTTRNPAFVISNLSRDLIFSISAVRVKEGSEYARQFSKNIPSSMRAIARGLRGKQSQTEADRYFQEFLDNGGETGFTALHNVDEYKRIVRKELKKLRNETDYLEAMKWVAGKFSTMNRWAEDVARFNAYMTSRQQGKTITESINDAKEVTVNFNRKGAGFKTKGFFGKTSGVFRGLYLFFNAAVQSLANFIKLGKKNPKTFFTLLGGFTSAGFLVPMINALLIGDGDDDYYGNLPDWVRRNNICIYVGDGKFFTLPLPIELRAFYGLGEIAYQATVGKDEYASENVAYAAINQITELLPLNPLSNNGDIVTTFMPNFFSPFWEAGTNEDFTGKPIFKRTPFNESMPEWTKAYKGTSSFLVDASKKLNEWTGGDKYRKGWIDKIHIRGFYLNNPAQIEHLFESYFGGMAKTFNQTAKTLAGGVESVLQGEKSDDLQWYSTPVLNRFINDASDDRSSFSKVNERYYKLYELYEEVDKELRGYGREAARGNWDYLDKLNRLYQSDDYKKYSIFKKNKRIIDRYGIWRRDFQKKRRRRKKSFKRRCRR